MPNPYEKSAERAAKKVNKKYADIILQISQIDNKRFKKLFPKASDNDKLLKLIKIVNSKTAQNQKAKVLKDNIEELSETIIKLVSYFSI